MTIRSPAGRRFLAVLNIPLLLLPLTVASPLILQGTWPDAHDGLRHLRLGEEFRDAFLHGHLYPRWLPELHGGWGYPTFVFYQPGYFFLFTLVSLLVPDTLLATQLAAVALLAAGGLGAAMLGRRLSGSAVTGAMVGLAFLLTPYVWVELFVRGDLSELAAMMATPWPLAFLLVTRDRLESGRPTALPLAATAVTLAAVPCFHPFVGLFFFPAFALVAVALALETAQGRERAFLRRAAAATALALALASIYVLPAFVSRQFVGWQGALDGYYTAELHVVQPGQLLSNRWGFGQSSPGPDDGMPFQLGLPHFLAALLGTIVSRRRASRLLLGGVYLGAVLVMTPVAAPLWRLDAVRIVQFPWRILAVVAVLQAMAFAGAGPLLAKLSTRRAILVLVAGAALCLAWNPRQFRWRAPQDDVRATLAAQPETDRRRMETWAAKNEFLPRTTDPLALRGPVGRRGDLEIVDGEADVVSEGSSRHRFRFRVSCSEPCTAALAQLWMPGWDVRRDGHRLAEAELLAALAADGRIRVRVPAGEHLVEARYGAPPGQPAASVAALAAALAWAAFALAERRRLSAPPGAR